MGSVLGKILRVNLTTGEVKKEELSNEQAKAFIGGRGLGGKMLADEIPVGIDALSEENKLFFITGPLSGTAAPTGGRYMVVTKSPLNDVIASSNSGGFWGAELKFAGYDMLIVEGKADAPVYISIKDDIVEVKPADHVWGKNTNETTDMLLEEFGDSKARVANIGTAGEQLSRIACIMNDRSRAAGRSGVGAVMGSKNLKAIVVRGSGKVEVAEPEKFKATIKDAMAKIKANGVTGEGLPAYGTAILVNIINEAGIFPTNNFQYGTFAQADEISGEAIAEKYMIKKDPCFRCPIACGRYCEVDGEQGGGPEYETVWAFGSDCGVGDLKSIIKANNACNEVGVDTISAGATIAAAMELYQRGLVKEEELAGGPDLKWGNSEAVIEWVKRMSDKDGFGAKLAMGSARLTESYGAPELSMAVKKLELPAYDPRGLMGHGLNYATANRGGCHVRGYMVSPEILGLPEALDRFSLEGKAEWVKIFQDLTAAIDSSGLCLFTSFALGAQDYADLLTYATGFEYTAESVLEAGDRCNNVERLFNLAEGYTAADDTLPKRFLEESLPEGATKGKVFPLDQLLPKYYEVRGWGADGVPTEDKKKALGL
ncbi:aldehyde ferredoxin oxidoreductase family protein [Dethiobacter alkaliphilus]|uniref:aldehyde ferredoxin oxidoreductase family protein n=1 Tax=Dethiobacter alkaliphilus TaxID=427926 RepID=UPI00222671E5|nr:aldehyde ferredoxin oxidoreductase family protein [Dethiobacter alkaliphilus]MCW3489151.1 aldehyde ferredoxin oxidoreductase family protein [Dethiobacter alkaliphilus]